MKTSYINKLVKRNIEGETFYYNSPMMNLPPLIQKKDKTEKEKQQAQILYELYRADRYYRRNL